MKKDIKKSDFYPTLILDIILYEKQGGVYIYPVWAVSLYQVYVISGILFIRFALNPVWAVSLYRVFVIPGLSQEIQRGRELTKWAAYVSDALEQVLDV